MCAKQVMQHVLATSEGVIALRQPSPWEREVRFWEGKLLSVAFYRVHGWQLRLIIVLAFVI